MLKVNGKSTGAFGATVGRIAAIAVLLATAVGCSSQAKRVQPVYFPAPPDTAHAVHLVSFNSMDELVSPKVTLAEVLGGGAASPFVTRPAGISFRDNHLYIADPGSSLVHDWGLKTGEVRRYFLEKGEPVDVVVADDGRLFVADTNRSAVIVLAHEGQELAALKPTGVESFRPGSVTIRGGKLYVGDLENHQIHVFDLGGAYERSLGEPGADEGQFAFPTGLATGPSDRLYVADMMNSRVQVFDGGDEPALVFGRPGNRYGDMGKPKKISVGPDGVVFVADMEFAHIHLWDAQGRLLMLMGGPEEVPGGTPLPTGVAVASSVPESVAQLVPANFDAHYYLFVANAVAERKLSVYAIGLGG